MTCLPHLHCWLGQNLQDSLPPLPKVWLWVTDMGTWGHGEGAPRGRPGGSVPRCEPSPNHLGNLPVAPLGLCSFMWTTALFRSLAPPFYGAPDASMSLQVRTNEKLGPRGKHVPNSPWHPTLFRSTLAVIADNK